jgi:hypothetical protein
MKLNKRALYSAAVVFLIGVGTTIHSLQYNIGTPARLGPGAFPLMIGVGLVLISFFLLFESKDELEEEEEAGFLLQYRGWGLVMVGAILFIVLGKHGGLIPATFASVFVAALGDRDTSFVSAFFLALGVTVFAVVVFHYGLSMPIPLLRWW